jgi:hypothetical protein
MLERKECWSSSPKDPFNLFNLSLRLIRPLAELLPLASLATAPFKRFERLERIEPFEPQKTAVCLTARFVVKYIRPNLLGHSHRAFGTLRIDVGK